MSKMSAVEGMSETNKSSLIVARKTPALPKIGFASKLVLTLALGSLE